jgi:prevent-host-death family protein
VSERAIAASQFKANCLELLDEIAVTGEDLVVTKDGRPVARVVAILPAVSLIGSVTQVVSDEDLIGRSGVGWDAESS